MELDLYFVGVCILMLIWKQLVLFFANYSDVDVTNTIGKKWAMVRLEVWDNFSRTGRMVKIWHFFIIFSSAVTKLFNFSQLF